MYTIYALIDPRDQSTRYIGITKDVYARMRQHSRCEGYNTAKNAWIQELQKEQLMFIMYSLEKVKTFDHALRREAVWIKAQIDAGLPLLNIAVAAGHVHRNSQGEGIRSGRRQKFRMADLCKVSFCIEGKTYRADTAPSEVFHALISEYIEDCSVSDWDSRNSRSTNLSALWKHVLAHNYEFPCVIEE